MSECIEKLHALWSLTVEYEEEEEDRPTTFDFDLFEDYYPLIVGLDLIINANTENMGDITVISIKIPTDS